MGTSLLHADVTERVLAAAFAVHGELGPGFLESVYEAALAHEFGLRGITFERQVEVPVYFRDEQVGKHRLDLIVEGKVVVELKCVTDFSDIHTSIVTSYLRATNMKIGLLLNFAKPSLEIKRVAYRAQPG